MVSMTLLPSRRLILVLQWAVAPTLPNSLLIWFSLIPTLQQSRRPWKKDG